jgi:hypothetical protein
VGFLDKAKKLAEQAKEAAGQAREKAEEALADVRARTESSGRSPADSAGSGPGAPADERMGTRYVPGMLGKPGWREEGLVDPAAVLPSGDRDRVGIPSSTRSEILEEPYGMGRRWTSGERSAGLFYRLTPAQRAWLPPGGLVLDPDAGGALFADLDDGRSVMFLGADEVQVVLEVRGLAHDERSALAESVAVQLAQL